MVSTADAQPASTVARLRRPGWRDPRLLAGVVLVLVSVAAGAWLFAVSSTTQPVYAAAHAITPGDVVRPEDLVVRQVRLDASAELYLSAGAGIAPGTVAVRPLDAGELVARAALGDAAQVNQRPVSIPLEQAPPSGLVKGARVDVWVIGPAQKAVTGGETGRPQPKPLVRSAVVAEVSQPADGLSIRSGRSVQVLVSGNDLPGLLAALADGSTISLVLAPGGPS